MEHGLGRKLQRGCSVAHFVWRNFGENEDGGVQKLICTVIGGAPEIAHGGGKKEKRWREWTKTVGSKF